MHWIVLSLLSAIFLGLYDIAKKSAVRENAVAPVLFFNVLTAAVIWLPLVVWSYTAPDGFPNSALKVSVLSPSEHLLLLAKAALVGMSWIFALFALKHLPMSIAAPIRASSPLWTILIAVTLMNERPSATQWTGMAIILGSFWAFSFAGRREGIQFHRNRWVAGMVLATLLGSLSALYDKYLLQRTALTPASVQAWFSIDLVLVMLPLYLHWRKHLSAGQPFQWRWSIPLIAILLLTADFLYFTAIRQPDAMISLISPLRRTSVIIAFIAGIRLYGEQNWKLKSACLAVLLIGVWVVSRA
ncbi:MAG: DMT family transporter [Planctomycetaceae bacterium]